MIKLEGQGTRGLNNQADHTAVCQSNYYSKVKLQLAKTFSKAAKVYQHKAEIQQCIANHLLDRIETEIRHKPPIHWLDLGCGSGYLLNQLVQRNNSDTHIGIDIAHGMLLEAQQITSSSFLNADAESLPLAGATISHVISSMALQWASSPQRVMAEIARVLRINGRASLAILRNDSLPELHQGWQHLGQGSRVNQFATRSDWCNAVEQAGLQIKQVNSQRFQTRHNNLLELLYSIKGVGAGTTLNNTAQPLRRQDLKALEQWWRQEYQVDNSLTLTYIVDFWYLTRHQ